MPRDDAYELMRDVLKGLLPSLERIARTAKNTPARKNLIVQIEQIQEALRAAEEASRELMTSREVGKAQREPAASPGS
jgi:hypothetical protein